MTVAKTPLTPRESFSALGSLALFGALALGPSTALGNVRSPVRVMSRNLYVGADVFAVVAAGQDPQPLAIPVAVAEAFQTVQRTNFSERAEALAEEVLRARPHVLGLQEVPLYRVQSPGDAHLGNPTQAEDVVLDFLDMFQAALQARGLDYRVAASSQNSDLELPLLAGFAEGGAGQLLDDLRMTDRDVLLVRSDLPSKDELAGNFSVNAAYAVGATTIEFNRGYTLATVEVGGVDYRVASAHLEVQGAEPASTQATQMAELLELIDATTGASTPVVLMGDFNSAPTERPFEPATGALDPSGLVVPPYLQALEAGYVDAWLERKSPASGFTCCFDSALRDVSAQLTERIDFIFVDPGNRRFERVRAWTTGDTADSMTAGGLYPSDHAGVAASLSLRPRRGRHRRHRR